MRRRICLVGAALSVCLLASVAGTAIAASSHSSKSSAKTQKVKCSTGYSIAVADGQSGVLPPESSGTEYGTVRCGAPLGAGIQRDTFTVPTSGDTVAKYVMYFNTGSIHGTYDLTPQSSSLNFLATDWTGTMKVLGGTGAYKGAKGTGKMTCATNDGVHSNCTDKLKLSGA